MKVLSVAALALACSVHASTLKGDPASCSVLAVAMAEFAVGRDGGASLAQANQYFDQIVKDIYGTPNSVINDAEDVQYVKDVIARLWDEKNPMSKVGGSQLKVLVVKDCMAGHGSKKQPPQT